MCIIFLLVLWGQAIVGIDRIHKLWRERYTAELRKHSGDFELPGRLQLQGVRRMLHEATESHRAAEGCRVAEAQNLRENLNRSTEGLFQQLLLRIDETILRKCSLDCFAQVF